MCGETAGEMKVYIYMGACIFFLREHIKSLSIMHEADGILSFEGERKENELFCGASVVLMVSLKSSFDDIMGVLVRVLFE